MKFLCDQCKAKYQIADEKVVGKTVRMKCRKCGHLIEVRAAVTESSVASVPPAGPPSASGRPASRPPKPAPPRSTSLTASFTSARSPAPKPDRLPGALAGAFKTTVQREEEVSAPFDMSEVSPNDDWYVAVNGVPVGPVRVAEIRRKASLGAVNEDSLVWQEGLDEWRPLRSFPELAAIVRQAVSGARPSLPPPPPETRGSHPPPGRPVSARPPAPSATARAVMLPRAAPIGPPPRSNVVPITSRLATAERLATPVPGPASPGPGATSPLAAERHAVAAIATDPFAFPAAPPNAPVALSGDRSASVPATAERSRRAVPWMPIAMVAAACAFGITAAISIFLRPATPSPQPIAAAQAPIAPAAPPTAPSAPTESSDPAPIAAPPTRAQVASTGAHASSSSTASAGRSLDLHGLTQSATVALGDDPGIGAGAAAAGQCLSQGQILQVIGQHQVAVRRLCWDRNPTARPSVGIAVSMTVAPDGTTQSVSASGDDTAVAKCIENDIRSNWRFGSVGCSQRISIPFKFVRQ